MLLGMAIPALVAVVESFLLAASVVVMLAMAINTMGLSCRWRTVQAKRECGACRCGSKTHTVKHRLFATALTVWMREPEVVSEVR